MYQRKKLGRFKCESSDRLGSRDLYVLEAGTYESIMSLLSNLPTKDKPIFIVGIPQKECYQFGDTTITIGPKTSKNNLCIGIYHNKPEKRQETLKKLVDAFK